MASSEIQRLLKDRERLGESHRSGASGLDVARGLSDAMDRAVRRIWDSLDPPGASALVATGGYGRREMSPHSDVDVIVIHAKKTDPTEAAKAVAYQLWDAGLELGYAIHTVKEAAKLAKGRLDSEGAFLDSRLIAGDQALFEEFDASVGRNGKTSKSFLARVVEATRARHAASGDAGAELEPDLKDGRGGLRDLTVLRWLDPTTADTGYFENAATVEGPQPGLSEELTAALDFLLRIRAELHHQTGRRTDVLSMQLQPRVAEALESERGDFPSEDTLMRSLYGHCRRVAFALDAKLDPPAVAAALERVETLTSSVQTWREARRPAHGPRFRSEEERWPETSRSDFLSLLRGSDPTTIEAAEITGALAELIPQWENVRCLPQRNVYHHSAVDTHTFAAIRAANQIMGDAAEAADAEPRPDHIDDVELHADHIDDLVAAAAKHAADDHDILLLAILLHDIGKGEREDHSTRGARLAQRVLHRMGLHGEEAEIITWLVANHLLLAKTATRRDIGDEKLILKLADEVGDQRRLRLLFLLSAADAMATSAAAWGQWKATLVSRLFARVSHALENPEFAGTEAGHLVAETIERLTSAIQGELTSLRSQQDSPDVPRELVRRLHERYTFSSEEIHAHIEGMPRNWLLSHPDDVLIHHSIMMLTRQGLGTRSSTLRDPSSGIITATYITQDRPGLFSKVAGCLAIHGLNVLGAEIYTREDGVALEVFRLEAVEQEEDRFHRVSQDIRKALDGKLALEPRLATKRRDYAGRTPKGKQEPPEVRIDNTAPDFATVLEVHATDRIGLLYTITKTLADLGLDITLAKVSTYAEDVVDVFYVQDLDGQKVTEDDHISEIRRAILHALETP